MPSSITSQGSVPPVFFVEQLTLLTWSLWVWPRLLWSRLKGSSGPSTCYFIDGSSLAAVFARLTVNTTGAILEKLHFRQVDIRDKDGSRLVRLRIDYQDLAEVQEYVLQEPAFRELIDDEDLPIPLQVFLRKSIIDGDWVTDPCTLRRALLLVQVCSWKVQQDDAPKGEPVLFIETRTWLNAISHYASDYGVQLVSVPARIYLRSTVRRYLPHRVWNWLRTLRYRSPGPGPSPVDSSLPMVDADGERERLWKFKERLKADYTPGPHIAVDYYGQLNLDQPELHSDLFFWQMSPISGKDLLMVFSVPRDPLDEGKLAQLAGHDIRPILLHPGAATVSGLPVYSPTSGRDRGPQHGLHSIKPQPGSKWLGHRLAKYHDLRAYWTELFAKHDVKMYVTWFKNSETHCAIVDSLQALGGLTAIYQRTFEGCPSPSLTACADVLFGFSPSGASVDRQANSVARYHVTTGYIGDHRFPLLKQDAQEVRQRLQSKGAEKIIAFFDENSTDDLRWHTGHGLVQENYAFLLEKLLANPWLGLVIKPKSPGSLRRRLGPVAEILERALATGRCHIYETGVLHGSHPPAGAALAADIAIHGHLCAGTAGMEAALAGVPTLLVDREGWPDSPLHGLGGKVVFTEWEPLWDACRQQWSSPEGLDGLGDWSPMLGELDPFRDGRAAERIGTYLGWMLDGFKCGLDRETVMAQAAERYCNLWGNDKVTNVNGGMWQEHAHTGADSNPLTQKLGQPGGSSLARIQE